MSQKTPIYRNKWELNFSYGLSFAGPEIASKIYSEVFQKVHLTGVESCI